MNDEDQVEATVHADASDMGGSSAKLAPVSVVVPCFRCAATIDDAVASIAAQTLRPAEVLLVDDGSGDDTVAALHRVAAVHGTDWIKVIVLPANGGPSRARNSAWQQAQQPYIAFLDADDSWGPRKLELQMAALQADPAIALIAHRMLVRPRGTAVPALRPPVDVQIIGRRTLLLRNPFPTTSVILRRDLPFRFDEDFWRSEDYLLWSRIVFSGYRCARIDQVLGIWNERERGATGLSDDFAAVHRARGEQRRKLMREGLLSRGEYAFSSAFGLVARMRRKLVLRLRRQGPYRPRA
ncbi:glycosyltransferase family 2 protein [Rhodanobacter sp. T12-5]|uniref:glycosyltransferase family 2 protein n=1 Tax=Rhodanobacter sp. T12-5 TaxID=2024611 RepID=UPI0011ED00CE|nr:glycosyltransferase family 2 protein [Rhodanobacter sp. T12-5]KAA0070688.1 glycosyltransferase family 2 protein [Rhodanobacter sp. T12-5]